MLGRPESLGGSGLTSTRRAEAEQDSVYTRLAGRPEAAGVILLILMTVFLTARTTTFATSENILWVLYSFSVIGLAAIGMLLVLTAADIDLSIGSQIGLAAIIAGRIVFHHPETPALLVFAAAIGSGVAFGLINGLIVAKLRFNAFIATLATGYIGRGLIVIISENRNLTGFSRDLVFWGQGATLGIPNLVWILVTFAAFWTWVLRKTIFGKYLFAIGGNASAAWLSGVPVDRIRILAFVFCGGMGGLAGFLLACRLGVAEQTIGVGYEMEAVAGAVIGGVSIFGGVGSVVGVMVGSAAMAVIRNGLVLLQIGAMWQMLATGIIIVIAVAIDGIRRRFRR